MLLHNDINLVCLSVCSEDSMSCRLADLVHMLHCHASMAILQTQIQHMYMMLTCCTRAISVLPLKSIIL